MGHIRRILRQRRDPVTNGILWARVTRSLHWPQFTPLLRAFRGLTAAKRYPANAPIRAHEIRKAGVLAISGYGAS